MSENPTPAAVMREAYDAEVALWDYRDYRSGDYEIFRHDVLILKGNWRQTPGGQGSRRFDTLRFEAGHRAALRALAAMEPTEEMVADACESMPWVASSPGFNIGDLTVMCRAYILAAASEGEKP